ncbi:hypothetical protein AURDEDRAFT_160579 [Auricularia subglabra TFB-10046 SS5]|nr:hypothetical protein AURDEDRAFT_160579 [Auricularia subglabra TFB-10046 SS5]
MHDDPNAQSTLASTIAAEAGSPTDGDIVLETPSGGQFRAQSVALARASGFFAAMFTDARPDVSSATTAPEVISVEEDNLTMTVLLNVAAGRPFPFNELRDMADIERIAQAADKYDIPAVLSILEVMMHAPVAREQPLRRYALAARYGWAAVRVDTEKELLDLEIDYANLPPMDMLHLARLLRLRQLRVSTLASILDDPDGEFKKGNVSRCLPGGHALSRPTAWDSIKAAVLWEVSRKPSGSTVPALLGSYSESTTSCSVCGRAGLTVNLWTWKHTCDKIIQAVNGLPSTLD